MVDLAGTNSLLLKIICGVPQGSCLAPLLFLIFINDMPQHLDVTTFLFADDTTLLATAKTEAKLMEKVNNELKKVTTWFAANKLTIHPDKTNYIKFYSTKMENFEIKLNGLKLDKIGEQQTSKYVKFVGIRVDEKLTWKYQLHEVSKILSKNIMVLNRVKHELPTKAKLLIYNTLIKPHAEYGAIIWHESTKTNNKLDKLQKRAIRSITNAAYNAHCEPIMKDMKLTKFSQITLLQAVAMIDAKHKGTLPQVVADNFQLRENRNSRSKSNSNLLPSKSRTINNIIQNWNSVSKIITSETSVKSAVKIVKNRLINDMESKCNKRKCYVCQKIARSFEQK